MNYNTSTGMAHFYDEDGGSLDKMKLDASRLQGDLELNLKRHLVELGQLELEEESSEAVFERLNRELGIEDFNLSSLRTINNNNNINNPNNAKIDHKTSVVKVKIPTIVSVKEPTHLFDVLYTRDTQKKSKIWHDGLLKYHPDLKLAEFYSEDAILLHKKVIESVAEGLMIETGSLFLEVCAERRQQQQQEMNKENGHEAGNTSIIDSTKKSSLPPPKPTITRTTAVTIVQKDSSSCKSFNILYTSDKQKKNKKWLDGRLEFSASTGLARFYSEEDTLFFKKCIKAEEATIGAEFESGQYLFQVDCEMDSLVVVSSNPPLPEVKRAKTISIIKSSNIPLQGRSDEELISLLRSKTTQINNKPETD